MFSSGSAHRIKGGEASDPAGMVRHGTRPIGRRRRPGSRRTAATKAPAAGGRPPHSRPRSGVPVLATPVETTAILASRGEPARSSGKACVPGRFCSPPAMAVGRWMVRLLARPAHALDLRLRLRIPKCQIRNRKFLSCGSCFEVSHNYR